MKRIIFISGLKRSGKDTVGDILFYHMNEAERTSLVAPMKEIVATTYDITLDELDYAKNNGRLKSFFKFKRLIFALVDFRKVLQIFANEAMKPLFGEDVWANLFYRNVHDSKTTIVSDWRFPEELILSDKYEIITVRVSRDKVGNSGDTHRSETALNDFPFDYTINNNGTLKDLEIEVEKFLNNYLVQQENT